MVTAIHTSQPQCKVLQGALMDLQILDDWTCTLQKWYEWYSVVCENYSHLMDAKDLLLSLETGFCYLNPEHCWTDANLTYTVSPTNG